MNCKVGPGVIARHNGINLAWMLAEKAAGYTVQREQRVQMGSRKKPADTLVWGWKGGDACAQDWAVVHPMTKAGLGKKKLDPYEAVEKAEERKRRAEAGMCEEAGVDFLPLAMDTFGGFGPSATEAMMVVVDQMRTLKGEEEEEKDYRAKRLAQKLRIWMLKFLARQVLSRSEVGKLDEMEEMEQVARILERTEVADVDAKERERGGETETEDEGEEIECCMSDKEGKVGAGKEAENTNRRRGDIRKAGLLENGEPETKSLSEQKETTGVGQEVEPEGEVAVITSGKPRPQRADLEGQRGEGEATEGRLKNSRKKRKEEVRRQRGQRKGGHGRGKVAKNRRRAKVGTKKKECEMDLCREWMVGQGLERWDVGQGRGGECQYLSVLASTDEKAWREYGGRICWNYARVDDLRRKVAKWLERNQDQCMAGGMSLRDMILEEHGGRGDEDARWNDYIRGVRSAQRSQWGDEFTLMALSGVVGRPIITLTGREREIPRVEERTPPEGWEMSTLSGAPILITHETDHHYTPVRFLEDSLWNWIPAWENSVREARARDEAGGDQGSRDARELEGRNAPVGEGNDMLGDGRDTAVVSAVQGCNDLLSLRPAALVNGVSDMDVDESGLLSWSAVSVMQVRSFSPSLRPVAEVQTMEVDEPEQLGWIECR